MTKPRALTKGQMALVRDVFGSTALGYRHESELIAEYLHNMRRELAGVFGVDPGPHWLELSDDERSVLIAAVQGVVIPALYAKGWLRRRKAEW